MDAIAAVVWGTILSVICAPDETIIDKIAPPYWGGAHKKAAVVDRGAFPLPQPLCHDPLHIDDRDRYSSIQERWSSARASRASRGRGDALLFYERLDHLFELLHLCEKGHCSVFFDNISKVLSIMIFPGPISSFGSGNGALRDGDHDLVSFQSFFMSTALNPNAS